MVLLLEELRDLDRTSPQFHRRLDSLISGNEYRQTIASLQGKDLAWLVEYLDEVLIGIPNHASLEFKELLCKLGKLCEMKQVLPKSSVLQGPLSVVSSLSASEGEHHDTRVRIKRASAHAGGDPGSAKRTFYQATVVWKHSTHPNIVPLLGVTTTPFQLISDWMPGGNLMEYIENHPNSDRQGFVSDVAEGLHYLHSCDVIHGSLKGSNILVDATGCARVTDFGFFMLTHSQITTQETSTEDHVRWLAPEVLSGQETHGKQSDIFSFAMVTIEVFTGAPPFNDKTSHGAVFAIVHGERPPQPTHPALTGKLWELIERCWDQEAGKRPQLEEILGCLEIPVWRPLLNCPLSMDKRVSLLKVMVSDRTETQVVKDLNREDAQSLVNMLDETLDFLEPRLRSKSLRALCRACGHHSLLPRSVQIPLCYDQSDEPSYYGGYSEVWKSEYEGRDVAVKVLKVSLSEVRKVRRRFCKEVMAWKALRHPNVLPLLGVMITRTQFAMASEWMANGNINEYIKANGDVNRFELLKDAVHGLIYMHGEGIVHGDLKGINILIDQHGHACLADFGLVTFLTDPAYPSASSSSSSECACTLRWASPELLDPERLGLEDKGHTKESDCYALAMVIYEVLSGRVPFAQYREMIVTEKIMVGERPERPADPKRVWFEGGLWEKLEQCWSPQPKDRPTVEGVLECLIKVSPAWQPLPPGADSGDFASWEFSSTQETAQSIREARSTIQGPSVAQKPFPWQSMSVKRASIFVQDRGATNLPGHQGGGSTLPPLQTQKKPAGRKSGARSQTAPLPQSPASTRSTPKKHFTFPIVRSPKPVETEGGPFHPPRQRKSGFSFASPRRLRKVVNVILGILRLRRATKTNKSTLG